jgi:hypothetical protein
MEIAQGTVYGQAQRFEHGMILRLELPRTLAPVQWVLMVKDEVTSQYWSFVMQTALLGSDTPIYRAWEHFPPVECCWPDEEFGALWVGMRDLLGWAVEDKIGYVFPYQPLSENPCELPRLYDETGKLIRLNPDRTWSVEPRHFPLPDAA